jgi:hypothetical protein
LSGTLTPGNYYVITGNSTTVPNTDLDLDIDTNMLQNDADAVALVHKASGAVVDALTYEGVLVAHEDLYSEGSPAPSDSNALAQARTGLSRISDGFDTNDNSADFGIRAITPGKANTTETNGTPSIEFSAASFSASEGIGTSSAITLIRTGFTDYASSIVLNVTGGTAVGGADYTDADFPKTIIFAPGETSKTVDVVINDDVLYEPGTEDTITFELSTVTDATLGSQTTTTLAVSDNDTQPSISTNTGLTVAEGATAVIDQSQLAVTDGEQLSAELTYTLTQVVQNGTLFLDGNGNSSYDAATDTALSLNSNFTQADIDANNLYYRHAGSETLSDSFGFTVSDGNGGSLDVQAFAITITPTNDSPELSGNVTFSAIYEDVTDTGNPGLTVAALVAGQITDADNNPTAIAITGVDDTHGTWQYSTDGGTTWNDLENVSDTAAVTLGATSLYTSNLGPDR